MLSSSDICLHPSLVNPRFNVFVKLSVCLREHRAIVLYAISPSSMKVCQFKGSTPKLKTTKWFLFWFFPGGD